MKTIQDTKNVGKRIFSTFNFQLLTLLLIATIMISCGNKAKTSDSSGEANTDVQTDRKTEQKASKDKKLPFERGSYIEESTTLGIEMQKTVYFDRWGDWMATESKSEMEIMKGHIHKSHKLEIVKGSKHWDLDLIERTGTTYEFNIPAGMAAAIGAAVGGQMMEGMEIKELGEEEYLGYKCKKTQVKYTQMEMVATTFSYGNLTMKMEGKMGKMDISTRIVSINLNAPPASIFEVPADIEIVEN